MRYYELEILIYYTEQSDASVACTKQFVNRFPNSGKKIEPK